MVGFFNFNFFKKQRIITGTYNKFDGIFSKKIIFLLTDSKGNDLKGR